MISYADCGMCKQPKDILYHIQEQERNLCIDCLEGADPRFDLIRKEN